MTDYTKLVKALRYCAESGDFKCGKDCPMHTEYPNCLTKMDTDAADAIEELQQIADHYEQSAKDWWKEAREYKIKSAQGLTAEESKELIKRFKSIPCGPIEQLPKRGEWISDRLVTINGGTYGVRRCSICEAYYQDIGYGWNYCPNCGAKMEVQE